MTRTRTNGQRRREQTEQTLAEERAHEIRIAKIQALAALDIHPKAKGIWMLITAGFTWDETKKILHVGKATIRDVLAGKELAEESRR